jgi:hypothetical protein
MAEILLTLKSSPCGGHAAQPHAQRRIGFDPIGAAADDRYIDLGG